MERRDLSHAVLDHAVKLAAEAQGDALVIAPAARDLDAKAAAFAALPPRTRIVIASNDGDDEAPPPDPRIARIALPHLSLPRLSVVKVALLLALSQGALKIGERVVCVAGPNASDYDTLVIVELGKEHEILGGPTGVQQLPAGVRTSVFQRLVELATQLAVEGREGRPVGTTFVLGDPRELEPFVKQLVFNPFRGYPEEERNVLDPRLEETVREFSALDGAFVIRSDGVIISAGTYLRAAAEAELEQGLGARHAAAAGVTAATDAVALVLSSSTGTVRVYARGQLLASIERGGNPNGAS